MPKLLRILPLVLAAACASAEPESLWPDGGIRRDAGWSPGYDAGDAWFDGGALPRDAGTPGPVQCSLGAAVVRLSETGVVHELGAVAEAPDTVAVAYARDRAAGGGFRLLLAPLGGAPIDAPATGLGSAFVPNALDYAGGLFVLAGGEESSPLRLGLAYFDDAGVQKATRTADGSIALAAARTATGSLAIALARPADPTPGLILRAQPYDAAGAPRSAYELARSGRAVLGTDLEWNAASDTGLACATVVDGEAEYLALFETGADSATLRRSAERLAPATDVNAAFGCRLASGDGFTAVALAETGGAPRLVWLGAGAATIAGPAPFLASYKADTQFDVAASGELTALAFFDRSSGSPQVAVRVYPGGGAKPVELRGEEGLGLGDFSVGRVRIVRGGPGFLLAFDAKPRAGQADVFVRPITCVR